MNNTEADVEVQLDDEAADEVSGNGGTVILSGECYAGPIVVTYADGRSIDLEGPICGGQQLLISDNAAKLQVSRTN